MPKRNRVYTYTDQFRNLVESQRQYAEQTFNERFWSRVLKTEDPTQCWVWHRQFGGHYPMVSCRHLSPARPQPAHRISYLLTYGSIPSSAHICHKCGNPACCNPQHLYAGTAKTNHEDCVRHGRFKFLKAKRGEAVHNAKVTMDSVLLVRRIYKLLQNREKGALASLMGVTRTHLRRLAIGESWQHVGSTEVK